MIANPLSLTCPCQHPNFHPVHVYDKSPEGEIQFSFSSGDAYHREIHQCRTCSHYISLHEMDTSELYAGDYVSSNYEGLEGIKRTFDKINALEPAQSDNIGRVQRVVSFANQYLQGAGRTIIDIGSGLCVFLYRMHEAGWQCTALDPDPRSTEHAKRNVGINAIHGDYMETTLSEQFCALTLNKVLEHVPDPVAMLAKTRQNITAGGFAYVEVPDGEQAAAAGFGREEFFIDHLHVFSETSLVSLAEKAGFEVCKKGRLQEPSSKFTLYAFLAPAKG